MRLFFVPGFRVATVDQATRFIRVKDDIYVGNEVYGVLRIERTRITDARVLADVRSISARLIDALPAEDRRFAFQIDVICNPAVDACALPGGHILVNTGLIIQARSAEELAGVLGHEMGHVTRRHGMRNIVSHAGIWTLLTAIFGDMRWTGHDEGLLADSHTSMKFSREDETEADQLGWTYLRRARLDSHGLAQFSNAWGITIHRNNPLQT